MAVTQISRIQHRRGLEQDLPQLSSAELGWSLDTRKLYIGNGTLDEGAPTLGVTQILTEHSDLTALLGTYTFVGNVTGYTVQTGSSLLNPVTRSFQQKFDDFVNVRDFGATGNGIDDDYAAINRAITQIYRTSNNETDPRTRRTIYIPGGTYLTSNTIQIPPFARLVGDGINSTIIKAKFGNISVANLCDSSFKSGPSIGSGTVILPQSIEISGMKFTNDNITVQEPIFNIDSASNIRITNTNFSSNVGNSTYSNIIHIKSHASSTKFVVLDTCQVLGGGNGIVNLGTGTTAINVVNSMFDNFANVVLVFNDIDTISLFNNYYGPQTGIISTRDLAKSFTSVGEVFSSGSNVLDGLFLGNLIQSTARGINVSNTSPVIATLVANTAAAVRYEISNSSAKRFGTLTFATDGVDNVFSDNYSETNISIKANLFANGNSITCSLDSGTGTFKVSFMQFI
jgi:hypothetical protein